MQAVPGSFASIQTGTFTISTQYFLLNGAQLPADGVQTVSIAHNGDDMSAAAIQLNGVSQTGPEAVAIDTQSSPSSFNTNITTLSDNALLIDLVGTGITSSTLTANSSQSTLWDIDASSSNSSGSSKIVGVAGSYGMQWSTSGANRAAHSVLAFAPAAFIPPQPAVPVLAAIGNQTLAAGSSLNVTIGATDSNSDTLSFSSSTLPGFITLTDNGDGTAQLAMAPKAADEGTTSVTITVSDGVLTDSENFNITVTPFVNDPPVIAAFGTFTVAANSTGIFPLSASDQESDPLTFASLDLPAFAILTDNGDGTAQLQITPSEADMGSTTSTLSVSDGINTSEALITIAVIAQGSSKVVISELLADGEDSLEDENGNNSDWFELHNEGDTDVNLAGWCASDDSEDPAQWCFPDMVLPADGYLLIFASGNDRIDPASELHSNFKLGKGGEYLGLFAPGGIEVYAYSPEFPGQFTDLSYGINDAGMLRYFDEPTPGGPNNAGISGILEFDETAAEFLDASSVNTAELALTASEDDAVTYALSVDDNNRGWLSATRLTGEDGVTEDQIQIRVNASGLPVGSYIGTVAASAADYLSAEIEVRFVVTNRALNAMEEADVELDGIGLSVDQAYNRLFYALGLGYDSPASFIPEVTYTENLGYSLRINGTDVASGDDFEFANVVYGGTATVELLQNGSVVSTYNLLFNNLPMIDLKSTTIVDEPKNEGLFRLTSGEFDQDTRFVGMGIEYRGNSAQNYPKIPYSIDLTEGTYPDDDLSEKLLDLRKDEDWIVDSQFRDTTFVRNLVSMDLARTIRPYAFIDENGVEHGKPSFEGRLTEVVLDNQYRGIHILQEVVDRKLLDLTKVDVPEDADGNELWSQVD